MRLPGNADARNAPTSSAQALRDGLAASAPGVWERPARSLPNRLATSLVPSLTPRPLVETVSPMK